MKILISGCGYVGTALALDFLRGGHEVWGLRRDGQACRELQKKGVQPVQADLLKLDSSSTLRAAMPKNIDHLVVCQAPSQKNDEYRDIYETATKNLLDYYRQEVKGEKTLKKILLLSSTSVYSTQDGSWVNENTDPLSQRHADAESWENAKILLSQEKLVASSGFPYLIFRLAGIYGPGRNRVRAMLDGKALPAWGGPWMNRIHQADIVRACKMLLEKGEAGSLYLGADDEPSKPRDFYTWLMETMSLPVPLDAELSRETEPRGKRCANAKLKALGFQFKYPNFRKGYEPLIREALLEKMKSGESARGDWVSR